MTMTATEITKQIKDMIHKASSIENDAAEIMFSLILMDRGETREQGMTDDWSWSPPEDPALRAAYDLLDHIGQGATCRIGMAAATLLDN